jgi:hypothetical protein
MAAKKEDNKREFEINNNYLANKPIKLFVNEDRALKYM